MVSVSGQPLPYLRTRPAHAAPSRLRRLLGFVVLCTVLVLLYLVQSHRIEAFIVTSESMEPALKVGDSYMMVPAREYQVGQIVVFRSPEDRATRLVKRLVAMPGDRVVLRDGRLYVNNKESIPPHGERLAIDLADRSWTLGNNQFFVAGDNRTASHDSREYGPIEREALLGVLDPKPVTNTWWLKLTNRVVRAML